LIGSLKVEPIERAVDLRVLGPDELSAALSRAFDGAANMVTALRLPWAHTNTPPQDIVLTPLHDPAGNVAGVILQYEALAGLGQAFLQAVESKAQLNAAINSVHEGVIILDQEGRILLANPFVHELYGLPHGRLLGLLPEELLGSLGGAFSETTALNAILPPADDRDPEEEWTSEYTLAYPRPRVVRHNTSPIYDEAGEFLGQVMLIHDVTAERAALHTRDELLSVASHELRTPLTTVKGFAQLLRRDLDRLGEAAPPRTGRHLTAILQQIDRLTRLVDELLDVSRIETGRLEPHRERCDLAAIAAEVVERLTQHAAQKGCHLTLQVPPSGAMGTWDPGLLDQVTTNLLDNAIRFSPQGGTIAVVITVQETIARCSVTDEGIGIPENQFAAIFEPFKHGTNARQQHLDGFGLGLYIARRLIERHEGQIWVESVEGRGSTFWFSLPLGA
jgi:PAS domain S-box-containing protein